MDEEIQITIKIAGVNQVDSDLNEVKNKVNGFGDNLQQGLGIKGIAIGTAIGQGITNAFSWAFNEVQDLAGQALDVIQQSVASASQLQQVALSFEVMLGSADKAKKLLQDLQNFASVTPFNLTDLQDDTKQLLAFGVSGEDVIPILQSLGNVAAGIGTDKLPVLIHALGQVKAGTVLSGRELNEFTMAGVPLIAQLSKITGFSQEDIAGGVKNLGITYDQVRQALDNLSAPGAQFENLMARQSKTVNGMVSNLEDFRDTLFRTIGGITSGGDLIKGGLLDTIQNNLTKLMQFLSDHQEDINKVGEALGKGFGDLADKYLPKLMDSLPSILTDLEKFGTDIPTRVDELKKTLSDLRNTLSTLKDVAGVSVRYIAAQFDYARAIITTILLGISNQILSVQAAWDRLTGNMNDLQNVEHQISENNKQITKSWTDATFAAAQLVDKVQQTRGATSDLGDQIARINAGINNSVTSVGAFKSSLSDANNSASSISQYMQTVSKTSVMKGGINLGLETGGIIPRAENVIIAGNDTKGDRQFIRANSGEMIINQSDQHALFAFIKSLSTKPQQVNNINFNNNGSPQGHNMANNLTNMLTHF